MCERSYVCMYACMYVCMNVRLHECTHMYNVMLKIHYVIKNTTTIGRRTQDYYLRGYAATSIAQQ